MADDKTKIGKQDRIRINTSEDHAVLEWAKIYGVTPDRIREAVKKVGPLSKDVEKELKE